MIYEVLQNTKGNPNDKANLDATILGKLGNTHYVENYEVVADIEADNLDEALMACEMWNATLIGKE